MRSSHLDEEAEQRTAQLAAEGLLNRQIAERLVVTPRTVEFHLTNTYRKLQISSRRDLATALQDQTIQI